MNQLNLKQLWMESIHDSRLSIDKEKMYHVFEKSNKQENIIRAYEFADLFVGTILFFAAILILINDPSIFLDLPVMGKLGLMMLFLSFIIHHYLSWRIKSITMPVAPTLSILFEIQLSKLKARVTLLDNYKLLLVLGLTGVFILFISLSGKLSVIIISAIILSFLGLVIYTLAQKQINEEYRPLIEETEERILSLREEDRH